MAKPSVRTAGSPVARGKVAPAADMLAVDYVGRACVITILTPELDMSSSEELTSRLLALLNEGKSVRFVLDFEQVRFMESSCFGALVTFLKWLSRFEGRIALANVSANVRFLFSVTKLDKVFPIHGSVDTALHAVER